MQECNRLVVLVRYQPLWVRSVMIRWSFIGLLLVLQSQPILSWSLDRISSSPATPRSTGIGSASVSVKSNHPDAADMLIGSSHEEAPLDRRALLQYGFGVVGSAGSAWFWPGAAAVAKAEDDPDDYASIAARATQLSRDMNNEKSGDSGTTVKTAASATAISAYDFSLPLAGKVTPFQDIVRQEFGPTPRVKAIVVVNMKQDDPVARRAIPELISLAAKYGREGSLAVVACPTDQGYYEPDTSQLIRLKLAAEYGYGINPSTVTTDKVNVLGSGAHPFWRWLQSTCRAPSGLGRIQGNFEKFLLDGQTGLPLRRYPRKYSPLNMADDIEAVIAGKSQLPPPGSNWMEEWREAAVEAERDTYRFEKGLNYFDS